MKLWNTMTAKTHDNKKVFTKMIIVTIFMILISTGIINNISTGNSQILKDEEKFEKNYKTNNNLINKGNTYYLDSKNGSDSNNGTSIKSPWKTIDKLNEAWKNNVISKGDDIFFKRGNNFTWPSRIYPRKGGSKYNPMIIGSYGKGNKPILCNSLRGTNGKTIQGLHMDYTGHYIFQDLNITGCGDEGIHINQLGVNNITIRRIDFNNIGGYGVLLQHVNRFLIENCTANNIGASAFLAFGSYKDHTRNGKFWNLTINNCGVDGIVFHFENENLRPVGSNHWIENVTISECGEAGIDVTFGKNPRANLYVHNVEIWNCTQGGIAAGHYSSYETYDNIYIHDQDNFIFGNTNDNNLILRNSIIEKWNNLCTVISQNKDNHNAKNIVYYNNAFISNGQKDYIKIFHSEAGETRHLSFKNNIFFSKEYFSPDRYIFYVNSGMNLTNTNSSWSNNIYWRGDGGSSDDDWWYLPEEKYISFNEWLSKPEVSNEIKKDPKFKSLTNGKFELNFTSPCIDTGDWLTYTVTKGTGDTLILENANFFMDGYDIEGLSGDEIIIGNNDPVEIIGIDYSRNKITVNKSISWSKEDPVTLLIKDVGHWDKPRNNEKLLYGKPDIGPNEFIPNLNTKNNLIDTSSKVRLYSDGSFRYLENTTNNQYFNLTFILDNNKNKISNTVFDLKVLKYSDDGDFIRKWKEIPSNYHKNITYIVGDIYGHDELMLNINNEESKKVKVANGSVIFSLSSPVKNRTIELIPLEIPIISFDKSQPIGYTGDKYDFDITLYDNEEVKSCFLEYWYGNIVLHHNESMNNNNTIGKYKTFNYELKITDNSTDPLNYIIHAVDNEGNWVTSKKNIITIIDNDHPIIIKDNSTKNATTGDKFEFKEYFYDNIKLNNISLIYWYNKDLTTKVNLKEDNKYFYSIDIPENMTGVLNYFYILNDTEGNSFISKTKSLTIKDNDAPTIYGIYSPNHANTGDFINISVNFKDNIAIKNTFLEYWYFSQKETYNISIFNKEIIKIKVPINSTNDLYYRFHISDNNENWVTSETNKINITDNIEPCYEMKKITSICYQGDELTFNIKAFDNIEIKEVILRYWFKEGDIKQVVLNSKDKNLFEKIIKITEYKTQFLKYRFLIKDTSSNINLTEIKTIEIKQKNLNEYIYDNTNNTAFNGEVFTVDIVINNTEKIKNILINYWFDGEKKIYSKLMEKDTKNIYYNIEIPISHVKTLYYQIDITFYNNSSTSLSDKEVKILDKIPPKIIFDIENGLTITRSATHIEVKVTDNFNQSSVILEYRSVNSELKHIEMKKLYEKYIVSLESNNLLEYFRFLASDTSGNVAISKLYRVNKTSNSSDFGKIEDIEIGYVNIKLSNNNIKKGEYVKLNLKVFDIKNNIIPNDIFIIKWEILEGKGEIKDNYTFISKQVTRTLIQVSIINGDEKTNQQLWLDVKDISENTDSDIKKNSENRINWLLILVIFLVIVVVILISLLLKGVNTDNPEVLEEIEINNHDELINEPIEKVNIDIEPKVEDQIFYKPKYQDIPDINEEEKITEDVEMSIESLESEEFYRESDEKVDLKSIIEEIENEINNEINKRENNDI